MSDLEAFVVVPLHGSLEISLNGDCKPPKKMSSVEQKRISSSCWAVPENQWLKRLYEIDAALSPNFICNFGRRINSKI